MDESQQSESKATQWMRVRHKAAYLQKVEIYVAFLGAVVVWALNGVVECSEPRCEPTVIGERLIAQWGD